ncbi:MAG: HNH endonuclease signature motif containing protein [Spirochaetes bacterium]|nr:HNH endonuclease signature motif containing protein [Spirochaetota bacterium]
MKFYVGVTDSTYAIGGIGFYSASAVQPLAMAWEFFRQGNGFAGFVESSPHLVSEGLLPRSDLHKLFDAGYLTVTPDLCVEVSRRIKEEYNNGAEYYAMQGRQLKSMPREGLVKSDRRFL